MSLLYIPAGKFTMGAINKDDLFTDDTANEKPIHAVSLDAFWIDKTEITNAMYKKCVDDQSCNPPTSTKSHSRDSYYGNSEFADYPVIYVSWEAAKAYCLWAGRRLPTEAEWEKAARGDDGRKYPWGNESPGANFLNKKYQVGDTAKVGQFPDGASPYGAFDMAGNVWEWVADWYSDKYYASAPESNPLGPESGQYHVLRGGSWNDSFLFLDHTFNSQPVYLYYFITWRVKGNQDNGAFNIGFRCAMSTTP
jgi:formylglycine-generating enzyme required for sulfatase activity